MEDPNNKEAISIVDTDMVTGDIQPNTNVVSPNLHQDDRDTALPALKPLPYHNLTQPLYFKFFDDIQTLPLSRLSVFI